MSKPLEGLTIIDLTRLLPGPFATWVLADWGARVIKVEEPGRGDYIRMLSEQAGAGTSYFDQLNAGKESVALDLRSPEGAEALRLLVKRHPVLVESFRPGFLDGIGLGYEALKAVSPPLVMCSISGYGRDGSRSKKAGHDLNYQSLAGLVSMNIPSGGRPGLPGSQIADIGGGGLSAAAAILAGVFRQKMKGEGGSIDISMTDWTSAFLPLTHAEASMGASPKGRETLLTGATVCYNLYAAADGKLLALAALEPKFFTSFCRAVGRSDWIESQFSPAKDGEPVYEEIKALFLKRPRDEWVELLKAADCCLEPVLDVAELQGHPMSGERGRFARDEGGTNRFMLPAAFGVRQGPLPRAPGLGEHTRKVLEEAGLDPGTLLKVMEAAERRDLS